MEYLTAHGGYEIEKLGLALELRYVYHTFSRFVRAAQHSAGWSSLVARRAHNPEVIGSNPVPATKIYSRSEAFASDLLCCV